MPYLHSIDYNNKYKCRDCKEYKEAEDMFFEDLCMVCFEERANEEANRKYDTRKEE